MRDYHQNNYKSDSYKINTWALIGTYVFITCVIFYGLYTF